jgi:hypothetical protein
MATTKKEIVESVVAALRGKDLSSQATTVINRCTEKVLKRCQQDTEARIKENADQTSLTFSQNLAKKLGDLTQTWIDNNKQDLMIYPEGTRFIHREGEVTVLILEQPPQVRTLKISGKFYHLAMPYTVFVLGFNGLKWSALKAGFRQAPLTSLNDHLLVAPLPNHGHGGQHGVCMGDFSPNFTKNKTSQANQVISAYWQTEFVSEGNFSEWEKKTKDDPLFVLKQNYNVGNRIIDLIAEFTKNIQNVDIVNTLKQEIITAVAAVGKNIQETILSLNLVRENKQKIAIETLDEVLKEIIQTAYAELWDHLNANLQKERLTMQKEVMAILQKQNNSTSSKRDYYE